MTRRSSSTRTGRSQAWPEGCNAPEYSCACPRCSSGQAGLRLKSGCPRIPPFTGTGHARPLQKPPGPCRSLQQGQVGCKESAELGRAQELSTAPARVQVPGPSGCSNPAPRLSSRADGAQFVVWTPHPGVIMLRHFMSFMQNANLCRFSCGTLSRSTESCALEVTCSRFAVAEVWEQCKKVGGLPGETRLPAHQGAC